MVKFIYVVVLSCISMLTIQAQESALYTVPVSDAYYAKVYLEDVNEVSSMGWIGVYDKQSDKELIRVDSADLFVDYDPEGNVSVNVVELPYGSQSVIIYDDFNFDGIRDFALRDGNMSCYGGPSYQVYLADGKGGFEYSDAFTDLAQNYCGFFATDYDAKRIYTMSKSGCCSHWFYTFDVVDNVPRIRKEVEESMNYSEPFSTNRTVTLWDEKGNKKVKNDKLLNMDVNDDSVIFSFNLKNKNRKVLIFDDTKILYYLFIKPDDAGNFVIDFNYPYADNDEYSELPNIIYNVSSREGKNIETLSFTNGSAQYQIYNSKDKVGIKVTVNGKVYDMEGDPSTRPVTYFFDKLEGVGFDNLTFDAQTRLDSTLDN